MLHWQKLVRGSCSTWISALFLQLYYFRVNPIIITEKKTDSTNNIPHINTHSLHLKSVLQGVQLWGIHPRNLLVCSKPTPCRCQCWASGPSQV